MKVRQAAGHLRLRGLAGAKGEWTLHVVCHNLRKLGKPAVTNRNQTPEDGDMTVIQAVLTLPECPTGRFGSRS